MPFYKVTDTVTGHEQYVTAKRVEQALNHVIEGRFDVQRIDVLDANPAETQDSPPDVLETGAIAGPASFHLTDAA